MPFSSLRDRSIWRFWVAIFLSSDDDLALQQLLQVVDRRELQTQPLLARRHEGGLVGDQLLARRRFSRALREIDLLLVRRLRRSAWRAWR